MELSIIICVYNTKKEYLEECLESITSSTLKNLGNGFEICMVDDGSSVDYSDIIEHYGIRVTKTENRGIFSARKTGVEMARGKYAIYCDSDDTVSFNYYLPMLKKAKETDADIVINDWATRTPGDRYYATKDETICTDIDVSGEDTLLAFAKNEGKQHSFYVLWNKLYKTELLLSSFEKLLAEEYGERTSYSEDTALNFFLWRDAIRVVNVHTGFYFYRIHEDQSVTVASEEKLRSQIDSMTKTLDIMKRNIGEDRNKEQILSHIREWELLMARTHFSSAKSAGYAGLFPYIKKKYRTDKLERSTASDGKFYRSTELLGVNFLDVEGALLSIYDSKVPVRCTYSKKDKYTHLAVSYLKELGKITCDPEAPLVEIPRFRIGIKKRIIHNPLVFRIGDTLFKKGSKARRFLKKFM